MTTQYFYINNICFIRTPAIEVTFVSLFFLLLNLLRVDYFGIAIKFAFRFKLFAVE
jgi:hypothetical protein